MASQSIVVSGEASETDSEDENSKSTNSTHKLNSIQGAAVTGEDSESDIDINTIVSNINSALMQSENNSPNNSKHVQKQENCDSLLHRKLRESNRDICKGLDSFFQSVTNDTEHSLNHTEQQLLRSQITLQNALTSLKTLNTHALSIRNKLKDILASNFVPNITPE